MHQTEPIHINPAEPANNMSDIQIISQVLDGNVEAFELLIKRYNQRLYRLVRGIVGEDHGAQDVLQESYVQAYLNLHNFRGPDGFPNWLHVITRNQAFAVLRSRKRELPMETNDVEKSMYNVQSPAVHDPHAALETRRLGIALERAVDKLPDTYRAVFVLRAIDGLSVNETALVLGLKEPTVKTRFHRARQILQHRLHRTQKAAVASVYEFAGIRCDTLTAAAMQKIRSTRQTTKPTHQK